MRFEWLRMFCTIVGVLWLFPLSLCAQPKRAAVTIPFKGCAADGQAGPVVAPEDTSVNLPINRKAAQQLAYYSHSESGIGVLAPRGWNCFDVYGSSGDTLSVSPEPAGRLNVLRKTFEGSEIQISFTFGQGSGALRVAEVLARAFPQYKSFVTQVGDLIDLPASQVRFGPYPADKLIYKSKTLVEFRTPPEAEGLGTQSGRVMKNGMPIDGVAILIGDSPDLLFLTVRLPPNLRRLSSTIIEQVERDAARRRN